MSGPAVRPGDWVRVGRNDAQVPPGVTGEVRAIHEESGNPVVEIPGRGRVSFTAASLTPLAISRDTKREETPMAVTCCEDGCEKPIQAKGLCAAHYAKQRYDAQKQGLAESAVENGGASGNGLSRDLYLIGADTAEELGLTGSQLAAMTREIGCGAKRGALTVYTLTDIQQLRDLQAVMTELEVGPAMAVKLARAIRQNRALLARVADAAS
ncbi:MAG: hypothetical protein ACRDJC_10560 [Thermomicrobiales bacterium]